ncbi:Alpha-protein kinase vwkA [Phytophthora citrophthora]|uniref:Alpha-protein kinase vwkA n=1 Tax=Phytophthora citrophthora TaxID=4793 RepID=A0AAD9GL83_9STRA|nr:Alpha-protein kinase vwkA [Phytophthora citrophthora]
MGRELQQIEYFNAIRSEMERRIKKVAKEIQQKYAKASALDLVIVMDCTGSMDPWIREAKAAIFSIIHNIKKSHPRANIRVGFVAYRDFCDGKKRIQTLELTSDVAAVKQFIASLEAIGGGDGPGDIPGGLEAALTMPFQAEAKRIVVIGDAPCHGSKFHDEDDNMTYRDQIERSPDICSQMRDMAARGIDFSFIEIEPNRTAKMVAILQEAFLDAESYDGFARDFQKLSLSKTGDISRFENVVASSASSSISASKQRTVLTTAKDVVGGTAGDGFVFMRRKQTPLEANEVFAPPDMKPISWRVLSYTRAIPAVRHSLHFRPGQHVDWKNLDLKHTHQDTTIRLSRSCFAMGAMRSAHALLDSNTEAHLVAKCYFGKAARVSSKSKHSLENDVKMQMVAKRLASEFSVSDNIDKGVDFIFTCWYEVKNPKEDGLSSSMAMFTAEPYIEGEYKKYNNNNGWIRDDGLDFSETAQAFSHFTWQRTFGELMVVDLQGVGGIFTDPQIHSKSGEFGYGNLSEVGMTAFFATHECNGVCSALGLKSLQSGKAKTKSMIKSKPVIKFKTRTSTNSKNNSDNHGAAALEKLSNKWMTCSYSLCGSIWKVLRNDFVVVYRKGREVYCGSCATRSKPITHASHVRMFALQY